MCCCQAFAADYWVSQGALPASVNVGLPLYGRSFTLADRGQSGVGAAARAGGKAGRFTAEAGYLAYYEVGPTTILLFIHAHGHNVLLVGYS